MSKKTKNNNNCPLLSDRNQAPYCSLGEGCIALRSGAAESQVPIQTVLTHHGEKTGIFQGQFKLQTSQGKQREKLYGKPVLQSSHTFGQEGQLSLKELFLFF